ncbi:MAG: malate dehydrogenase [Nitrosopumilus sp.]
MISIIGSGLVGSSIAFLCASQELDDIVLVNRTKDKAVGKALDISNSIPSNSQFSISGTDDWSKISGSKIIVIASSIGIYTNDRAEQIELQVQMINTISENISKYCPNAIILVVSNPLDVLTFFVQKFTNLPRFKVIGIASSLDSSRLRYCISKKINVTQNLVTGSLVLGEHGDSMVPIFSNVKISGKSVNQILSQDEIDSISSEVKQYWKTLRSFKTRSHCGIAKMTFDVIKSLVQSTPIEIPASVVLCGEYDQNQVCIGVPVRIESDGVSQIILKNLSDNEQKLFEISASKIKCQILSQISKGTN